MRPAAKTAAAGDPKVTNDDRLARPAHLNTATAESVNTAFVRLANAVTYNT